MDSRVFASYLGKSAAYFTSVIVAFNIAEWYEVYVSRKRCLKEIENYEICRKIFLQIAEEDWKNAEAGN